VDTRGAVDIAVVSHALTLAAPDQGALRAIDEHGRTLTWSQRDHLPPGVANWRNAELLRLMAAAVLQSYLKNTRQVRLDRVGLDRHPDTVTLAQLAVVHRDHPGVAGQSFEFAVAAAVNAGLPAVTERIKGALHQLAIPTDGPLGMVLLGLEKVAPRDKDLVYRLVLEQLPDGGVLRSGSRGRPMSAASALERIGKQDWHRLRTAEREHQRRDPGGTREWADRDAAELARTGVSQLARADALIYCGTAIVPTSLKVNPNAIARYGWKDVPLWITSSRAAAGPDVWEYPVPPQFRCPSAVAVLDGPFGTDGIFLQAVTAIDVILTAIDRGTSPSARYGRGTMELWRDLRRFADRPLTDAISYLELGSNPVVRELAGPLVITRNEVVTIPVLNNPVVKDTFTQPAKEGTLFTVQPHLFLPSGVRRSGR